MMPTLAHQGDIRKEQLPALQRALTEELGPDAG
jgi:hypothetical protein